MKQLLCKNNGKTRVEGRLKIRGNNKNILQVLYGGASPIVEEVNILEDSIEINGYLQTKCLYVTNDDMTPYDAVSGKIPFHYTMDAKGIKKDNQVRTKVVIEQLNAGMADSDNVEMKAVIQIQALIFTNSEQEFVTDVEVNELDMKKIKNLPQMVVYVAKEGDSLWQIGKKYYVPVAEIKEMNELSQDECKKGQKLLIVR
jgi:LysM repeat protein